MTSTASDQRSEARSATRPARVLGHVALYYRPGEERAARTLLTDLGCELVENGPRPGEDGFCSAVLDANTANHHDNVVYLGQMSDAQWMLEQQIAEVLRSAAGGTYRDRLAEWPEAGPHVGFKYESLEDLEAAVLAIEAHSAPGGPLAERVRVTCFRARPGLDAQIDERMDASPVFTADDRPAFGNHIVQCFVRTDLFGTMTSASTIELDYAFPPFYDRVPTFG